MSTPPKVKREPTPEERKAVAIARQGRLPPRKLVVTIPPKAALLRNPFL